MVRTIRNTRLDVFHRTIAAAEGESGKRKLADRALGLTEKSEGGAMSFHGTGDVPSLASMAAPNRRPTDEDFSDFFDTAQARACSRGFEDERLRVSENMPLVYRKDPPEADENQLASFKGLLLGLGMGVLFWLSIGALLLSHW